MKPRIKTILFLIVTVYIIPGIFVWWLDKKMLPFYLSTSSSTAILYYFWSAGKKHTCKLFGIEFKF